MNQILIKIVFILALYCPFQASAQVENGYYKLHAMYNAQGKNITNGTNVTQIFIYVWDSFGTTYMGVSEYSVIGGIEMPPIPLCPINDAFRYVGIKDGWYTFSYRNIVNVYVKNDVVRVEKRGFNNQYLGYSEFRK